METMLLGLVKTKAQPKMITKFALNHPTKLLRHLQAMYKAMFRYAAYF